MKKVIASVVIVLAGLSIMYGGIKPYKKASLYVSAVKANPSSVQEFIAQFKKAFDYPSPVGQDELIRFIANDVSSVVGNNKNDEAVAQALVDFIHHYADPKIQEGVGMNYTQIVMMMGTIHTNKWKAYGKQEDYDKAVQYFLLGYNINHDRPQFLIGLLGLYQASGEKEKADAIQKHIAELWNIK